MKKVIVLLLSVVCLFTFCACGNSDGLTASDVAGTWVEDLGDGTETLILNEDMTYTKTIVVTNPYVEMVSEGTYELSGDSIVINYPDYNTSSEYKITLSDTTMTLDSGTSEIVYTKQ